MSNEIPVLWPIDSIKVDIASPVAILRTQATALSRLTGGLLQAEVNGEHVDRLKQFVRYKFDIVAPALNNYRRTLFTVEHNDLLVYPVMLETDEGQIYTNSQENFTKEVGIALSSKDVVALVQSLIAKINDVEKPLIAE